MYRITYPCYYITNILHTKQTHFNFFLEADDSCDHPLTGVPNIVLPVGHGTRKPSQRFTGGSVLRFDVEAKTKHRSVVRPERPLASVIPRHPMGQWITQADSQKSK